MADDGGGGPPGGGGGRGGPLDLAAAQAEVLLDPVWHSVVVFGEPGTRCGSGVAFFYAFPKGIPVGKWVCLDCLRGPSVADRLPPARAVGRGSS